MKKIFLLSSFVLMLFISKITSAQIIDTPIEHELNPKLYVIKGRILGINLENVQGARITNIRTAESINSDSYGFYHINAAWGDSLAFYFSRYSKDTVIVKSHKENLNIIMIKRKVDELPPGYSQLDYYEANKKDHELYHILNKDAKLEGKWKY